MRHVTLDASTKVTGCALFEDGKLIDHCAINFSKEADSEKRMNMMCEAIVRKLQEYRPDQIWGEYPEGNGHNVLVVHHISEILGAIRLYATLRHIEFHEAKPNEWRSWAGIPTGRRKRDELKMAAREMVYELYGIYPIEDECEAIIFGHGVLNAFG